MTDQTDATFQEVFSQFSSTEAVKLLPWCVSLAVPFHYISGTMTTAAQQDENIPTVPQPCPTAPKPESYGSPTPGTFGSPIPPPRASPLPVSSLPDIPLVGTPLVGCPFSDFLAVSSEGKQSHPPSSSPGHHDPRKTYVCSPEVEVGVESSFSWGKQDTPELVPESRPRPCSQQRGQDTTSPPSPSSATVSLIGRTAAGSPKSTKDLGSSSSGSFQVNVDDSDPDTTSGDWLTCSNTDDASVWTACNKYRKRVWVSCKLSKSNPWKETQQKRINKSHQNIWGKDQKIIKMEQKCTLAEDHMSFKMRKMMTRVDQLLCIDKATGSQIHNKKSEAEAHSQARALVLSLKQYHAHFYRFYEKGTSRAMVGLQGLHKSDAFWHSNVSVRVGLKSFCPWYFKLGGNTETIAVQLREVHYHLAIVCDLSQSFASMSAQAILQHGSGCKVHPHKNIKGKEAGQNILKLA